MHIKSDRMNEKSNKEINTTILKPTHSYPEPKRTTAISFGVNIVYVIESAAYGVLFTSCLCQKPSLARTSLVRVFDTNNSWIKPCTKHFLCRELFITQNKIIFIELAFRTQIRNKNSLTTEANANLSYSITKYDLHDLHEMHEWLAWKRLCAIVDWLYFHMWNSCTQFWLAV